MRCKQQRRGAGAQVARDDANAFRRAAGSRFTSLTSAHAPTAAFNAAQDHRTARRVKFMFATTDPECVLATILSRCQQFDLSAHPHRSSSKSRTSRGLEQVKIDGWRCYAIARVADGGMRDAESTLDQLISFCGDKIEEADVLTMFGLHGARANPDLSRAVLAGRDSYRCIS